MKIKFFFFVSAVTLSAFVCGNLSAQSTTSCYKSAIPSTTQAVVNTAIANQDILVISGKIMDAVAKQPIANAKINFDKFGEELLQASIDEKGNYALALNKKELGEPIRVIFKIQGYKRYVIKNIDKAQTYLDADIYLQPAESDEKSIADIKYIMSDDPFNTMVIKMQ